MKRFVISAWSTLLFVGGIATAQDAASVLVLPFIVDKSLLPAEALTGLALQNLIEHSLFENPAISESWAVNQYRSILPDNRKFNQFFAQTFVPTVPGSIATVVVKGSLRRAGGKIVLDCDFIRSQSSYRERNTFIVDLPGLVMLRHEFNQVISSVLNIEPLPQSHWRPESLTVSSLAAAGRVLKAYVTSIVYGGRQTDADIELMRVLADAAPTSYLLANNMAWMYLVRRDWKLAHTVLSRSRALNPQGLDTLDGLRHLALNTGDLPGARAVALDKAKLRRIPENTALYALALEFGERGHDDLDNGAKREAAANYGRHFELLKELRHPEAALARLSQAQALAQLGAQGRSEAKAMVEEADALFANVGNQAGRAKAGNVFGAILFDERKWEAAESAWSQGLALLRTSNDPDPAIMVALLANLAEVTIRLGDLSLASGHCKEADKSASKVADRVKLVEMNIVCATSDRLGGNYSRSLGRFKWAWENIQGPVGALVLQVRAKVLNNWGATLDFMGHLSEAIKRYRSAAELFAQLRDAEAESIALTNVAIAYQKLGDAKQSSEYLEQASKLVGSGELPRIGVLNASGSLTLIKGQPQEAVKLHQRAIEVAQQREDRQGIVVSLNALVAAREASDDPAMLSSAIIAVEASSESSLRDSEVIALGNLGAIAYKLQRPVAAAFFMKLSINGTQELRESLPPDRVAQNSYIFREQDTFRYLASLLLAPDQESLWRRRPAEALQVIQMYRQEDIVQQTRSVAGGTQLKRVRASYTLREARLAEEYEGFRRRFSEIGIGLRGFVAIGMPETEIPSWAKPWLALRTAAREEFREWNASLLANSREFDLAQDRLESTPQLLEVQSQVAAFQKLTAFIVSHSGDKALRLLMVLPQGQPIVIERATSAKVLADLVSRFRRAMELEAGDHYPRRDPKLASRAVYGELMEPLWPTLLESRVQHVLWALDGPLRHVPIYALHNGRQYLVEYQITHSTYGPNSSIAVAPVKTALAAGVTDSVRGLPALPCVSGEMRRLVNDPTAPPFVFDPQCIFPASLPRTRLPGTVLVGKQYNWITLQQRLKSDKPSLLLLEGHFDLNPQSALLSGLILGDGSRVTLGTLEAESSAAFGGVEVLIAAGCRTALPASNSDGREVDGLALLAQVHGSRTVLASLWAVTDGLIAPLLESFLEPLTGAGKTSITRADAHRMAQLSILRGTTLPASTKSELYEAQRRERSLRPKLNGGEYSLDAGRPLSHPYFWAPFVLSGVWQ